VSSPTATFLPVASCVLLRTLFVCVCVASLFLMIAYCTDHHETCSCSFLTRVPRVSSPFRCAECSCNNLSGRLRLVAFPGFSVPPLLLLPARSAWRAAVSPHLTTRKALFCFFYCPSHSSFSCASRARDRFARPPIDKPALVLHCAASPSSLSPPSPAPALFLSSVRVVADHEDSLSFAPHQMRSTLPAPPAGRGAFPSHC
jgi:hypothetical protein